MEQRTTGTTGATSIGLQLQYIATFSQAFSSLLIQVWRMVCRMENSI